MASTDPEKVQPQLETNEKVDMARDEKVDNTRNEKLGDEESISHVEDALDLNNNAAARIRNPLFGLSREALLADVDKFAKQYDLHHILPQLQKGAILAQNPLDFETQDTLTPEERDIIRHERAHKWSHPKTLYLTIIICSIGAAVQGWDQTGSNGANLSFPDQFGIGSGSKADAWLIGLINSAPYIGASLCGCWLSDPLNNILGRRKVIFITALVLIITPICSGLTRSWRELFIVRLILGIAMGCKGATVPIFAAENSPAQIRGALVMSWQLWTAFGIFIGYIANLVVLGTGAIAWRLQVGSAFIPALPLALGILFCPESPRWLMKKGRYAEAYKSLCRVRFSEVQAARDLYYIGVQLRAEAVLTAGRPTSFFERFAELFTIPRVRRATVASGVVMIAQQMCGINIIAFYSSTVFADAGASNIVALAASVGFGAVNFVFAFPALFTIDTFGRRSLLLFTFPQMTWTLLAAGLCFLIPQSKGSVSIGIPALFIYLFAAFYSPGEGPVPFTYSAEVFPLAQREMGMAWAVSTCLFWAAVLSISFPAIVQAMTIVGAFGFYAGLNVVAFFLIFFFVPETKQRTLEELDQIFSVPTSVFIRYNVSKAAPYWFKRWVLFRKNVTLEPLYHIEGELEGDNARAQ